MVPQLGRQRRHHQGQIWPALVQGKLHDLFLSDIFTSVSNKLFQIWELFLAWSVIASRQGSATCFQMVVVKNLNSTHRIDGVASQFGLSGAIAKARAAGRGVLPN